MHKFDKSLDTCFNNINNFLTLTANTNEEYIEYKSENRFIIVETYSFKVTLTSNNNST